MVDFEAACAQLRSSQLAAVAEGEGIVWGQIKGYPFWPVSVCAGRRRAASRRLLHAGNSSSAAPAAAPLSTARHCLVLALISIACPLPCRCAGPAHLARSGGQG